MKYTPQYEALQRELHSHGEYGVSGHRYADYVMRLAENMKTRDILDYACGQATLQKSIPFSIQNYDPFIPEYSKYPNPAALVVCTDVLEHIEIDCLEDVLTDLQSLTGSLIMLQIATRPARKFLADGRNAHLIQEPISWWVPRIMKYFDLQNLANQKGEFLSIWTPFERSE